MAGFEYLPLAGGEMRVEGDPIPVIVHGFLRKIILIEGFEVASVRFTQPWGGWKCDDVGRSLVMVRHSLVGAPQRVGFAPAWISEGVRGAW